MEGTGNGTIINSTTDNKQLWADYEQLLKSHDWYYAMSDDHRVYTAGNAARNRIETMKDRLAEIDAERAERLFKQYWK